MTDQPIVHVVDDDEGLRDALTALLRMAGFAVRAYPDAAAVLAAIRPDSAGCVIADVRMPGMSGLELQQELLRRDIRLPVIVVTGHGDVPMAVAALKAGALDFFEKPFDDRKLIERIGDALDCDSRRRESRESLAKTIERLQQLSPREREVMELVAQGLANKVIAHQLGIGARTVETHRARVMEKTGAANVSDLTRMILQVQAKGLGSVITRIPPADIID